MKHANIIKSIFTTVALCATSSLFAYTATVNGITWKYWVSNGTAFISGENSVDAAIPTSTTGAITIPSMLGGYPVTSIGSGAFFKCSGLTSVTIPNGVTSIGVDAFSGCSGLTSVTIPNSVTNIGFWAFRNCSGLTSVTIPDSMTSIGNSAFFDCSGLTSVTIPNSVTRIGDYAFEGCSELTSVTIPNSVTSIEFGVFGYCRGLTSVTIPDSVTNVHCSAFGGSGVRFVKFGKGLRYLDYEAFGGDGFSNAPLEIMVFTGNAPDVTDNTFDGSAHCCVYVPRGSTGWGVDIPGTWKCMPIEYIDEPVFTTQNRVLTSVDLRGTTDVTIPDYVTAIGPGAFSNRIELLSVSIPNSVTNISENAFWGCISLSEITVPNSVQSIGYAAFGGCSGLKSMTLPFVGARRGGDSGDEAIFGYVFGSSSYSGGTMVCPGTAGKYFCVPASLREIVITDETSIGSAAFQNCEMLTSVTMPGSVTNIGYFAFRNCYGLTSVAIPDGVMKIWDGAFWGCSALTSVTIPDSVERICEDAFTSCVGLKSVTIYGSGTSVHVYAFSDCTNVCEATVPGRKCGIPFNNVTNLTILAGTTSIPDSAFRNCSRLTSVTIPDGVTSIGNGAFYGCSGLTSVTIPDSVASIGMSAFCGCSGLTSVKIGYGVTSIDECAFEGCSRLTSVTIPASVTSIGKLAFYGCGGLLSFVVGDGNPNYKSVNGLLLSKDGKTLVAGINGDVTIPDSVTSIGDYAFSGCSGLTSVTIPNSVTNIESYSFGNCSGLTSVTIPDSVASVGIGAFVGTGLRFVKFGKGLRSLAYEAFSAEDLLSSPPPLEIMVLAGDAPVSSLDEVEQCRVFVSRNSTGWGVDIPGIWGGMRIEYIDEPVFTTQNGVLTSVDLRGTTDVTIPDYVTAIGPGAFSNRIELLSVSIPNSVTNIGENAFWGCISLSEITVPNSVQSIGYAAFSGCSGLKSMTLPFVGARRGSGWSSLNDGYEVLIGYVFGSSPYSGGTVVHSSYPPFDGVVPSSLREVVITDDTGIGESAFMGCTMLTSVKIQDGVTSIGGSAFYGCSGLTSVSIPDGVTRIGGAAFQGCSSLTSVTIPNSVTDLGTWMFTYCSELKSVTIGTGVTYIGEATFHQCGSLTSIYISDLAAWCGIDFDDADIDTPHKLFLNGMEITDLTIPGTVTSINKSVFENCTGIKSVTIPASVTNIAWNAFYGCTNVCEATVPGWKCGIPFDNVTNLTISAGTTSIGDSAFWGCPSLTSVSIPGSVEAIGEDAFGSCCNLSLLTIEKGFRYDLDDGFDYGSTNLTSIQIVDLAVWCENASYIPINWRHLIVDGKEVTDLVIPDSVTNVGNHAFWCCSGLTSVTVPGSVTSIGTDAFRFCANLTSVTIDNGVEVIGSDAFNSCGGLASATIPNSVTNIGKYAFNGTALTTVYVSFGDEERVKQMLSASGYDVAGVTFLMPEVTDVTARQRYPWNGKVDITYTLTGDVTVGLPPDRVAVLSVTASNRVDGAIYTADASALSGDTGTAEGAHHVVWDLNAQGLEIKSDEVVFTVAYVTPPPYCVIDLSGGVDAASYPVSYLADVPSGGFNTDEYKTTKLVLRLIEPGTFMMRGSYQVTLTKPFYCGVFEVTQRQWELVMGTRPSYFTNDSYYAARPVEKVSYDMIRGSSAGAGWPGSSAVDADSFMGRLRARAGIDGFDLPTEAQWEYACRAGTTTTYSYGDSAEGNYMWYSSNSSSQSHVVGTKQPNAWGLYDMHGNVWEWCLDWYGSLSSGVTDPVGSSSGSDRVRRGGGWHYAAVNCTSSRRDGGNPSGESSSVGFRLVRALSNPDGERSPEAVAGAERAVICAAKAAPVAIDSRIGVRESDGEETLTYSSRWDGGDGATVTITQDGVAIAEGLTGEDTYAWSVQKSGTYVLTHTTYTNGVAGKVDSATFNVPVKDIGLAQVNVDCSDVTYRGTAYEPAVQFVKWGDDTLVAGTDFTLAYSDNVDAGTATITLTGTNFYNGTYTTNFTIRPRPLTQGMVGAIGNHPYTGKAQMPKPMVTDAELGVTLREGVEYTLSYANNTAIGDGIVTVTGKGNYTGSIARTFVIEPSSGSELEESLGGAGKAESDGAGGWIVTITNDVDAANLPIEMPDDLGNVTIDLNGHDLIGGEGHPAIIIVPGDEEGEPTQLTIVTSEGDAIVQGGEGAPAIEVADGAQEGVLINIGAGVAAQGGGVPAIDGTIGENNGSLVKVEVPVPAVQGKEYTGSQLQADIAATERYAVQNDGGVDVGNYPVTLTLADSVNYRWAGGDSNPTTITFTVTKATNDWITKPTISGWVYGQPPNEPNMGEAKFGEVTVSYGALGTGRPVEVGSYVATFTVTETGNYTGLTKEVPFVIASAEETKLQEILDGLSVVVAPDGEGGLSVTLTNDIEAANLPLEIPDNLGPVTIDLNGHDLIGGDGRPAIVVVPGDGNGEPTVITIVNSGDGSEVRGGDGSSAIVVAEGAQGGVVINIGEGVTVRGGDDFTPTPIPTPTPGPEEVYELYAAVEGAAPAVAASEYNGYLYDAGGVVKGTIQVKVGKPGKDGKATIKAIVQVGARKATLKATDNGKATIAKDGPTTIQLVGGEACTVVLGEEGLSGSYGAYTIDGSRNFFSSKDKSEQGAANDLLTKWLGAVNVVWDGGNASVSIAKKGKAKVSVTLANGTKATASAQVLVGEKMLCVPVVVTKKANLAFALWLPLGGGQAIVDGLGNGAIAGKPGTLGAGAKFRLDAAEFAAVFGQAVLPYLPDGIVVTQSGAKWTLPKAGKVAYKNGAVDESKLGENPCGLKLTYKAKDGSFKGSFKVYAVDGGKVKATTVNVTGVMVNGVGYGTATIKGKGGVVVTIE